MTTIYTKIFRLMRAKSYCGVGMWFLMALCALPSLALGATGLLTTCLNDGDFLKCARGSTVIMDNPAGITSDQQPRPQRKYITYSGLPKWQNSTYRWFYNPNNQPAAFNTESMLTTISSYMAKWSAVCGIRFEYLGISQEMPSNAGPNMIGWSYAKGYAGYAQFSYSGTGDLVAFIVIDPNKVTSNYQIGGLMNHELGHVIGLDHSDVAASIMYANPYHSNDYQETLNDDDIKGCVALYGLPGAQSINFVTVPTITVGSTGVINATGGASGNAVIFSTTTPTVCTVASSTVTGVSVGNCVIAANQPGNAIFSAAPQATQTIAVNAGAQSVSFGLAPALAAGGTGMVTATGGASDNAVTFSSTTPLVCMVAGGTVTALIAGNCVVAANQSGNANYTAALQATQTIAVSAGAQSVTFGSAPSLVVGGAGTVMATGGASGNSVAFSSTTPLICTVDGSTVTALTVGNCVVAANQVGNSNYTSASQATQAIAVGAGAQSISFSLAPTLAVGGTGTVTATGGASGNAVTFSSTTPTVCRVSGSTVTALTAGSCVVAATQVGNANYFAATQATQTITVGSASLDISKGWNLLGNGMNQPLAVGTLFGAALNVTSVWKWDVASSGWQFYAPSMDAAALQSYASGKGYGVLSTINPGEGFWVNALQGFNTTLPSGSALVGSDFQPGSGHALAPGWNLVAIGNLLTPNAFNSGLSAVTPTAGVVPNNLTSLWAWDNPASKWYFYAASLEGQGGTALLDYTASKGYLDFTATGKTLGAGMGFWVNKP